MDSIAIVVAVVLIVAVVFLAGIYTSPQEKNFDQYLNQLKSLDYGTPKKNLNLPMYYINLEKSKDRDKEMMSQQKEHNLPLQRINGVNGNDFESTTNGEITLNSFKKINFINKFEDVAGENSKPVLGCTLSHLKAIYAAFVNNEEMAMILEDDTSFVTYNHWSNKIDEIVKNAPSDWRIINLFHFCDKSKDTRYISNDESTCLSTTCYLINKKGITEIINSVFQNNTIILQQNQRNNILPADYYIYGLVKTYHYDGDILIIPNLNLQSTIHTDHYNYQFMKTAQQIENFLQLYKNSQ